MSLLICVATGPELAGLLPDFAPPLETGAKSGGSDAPAASTAASWPEMQLWPTRLKTGNALCCITGVGPINAALALGHVLSRAEAEGTPVSAVLNAGLAGAFDLEANPLLSHCLVREEIWPEYGLHDGQSVTAGAFGFPQWQPPQGEAVRDKLTLPGVEALAPFGGKCAEDALPHCRSLTVAGVSASFARAADLRGRYKADLENMEGFAVAYACARQGIPCVEVRSVSNKVGPRAREEKDFPGALRSLAQVLPALNLI
ncbi:futalosine hydrolase [Desulfovibrio intestinalis]|uniref:Futalosine hydrolase n=1 Tax=Desulfovibrio intestinalis TaxID=58621 RepID=A0A7W8FFY3_9BACT|nr:futalosine hydrolase [Desulfovibrio intestinalis]